MRNWAPKLALSVLVFALTGCIIPLPRTGQVVVAPDIRGRVVDSVTREPLAFVELMVDHRPQTLARTAADGTFHIPESRKTYHMEFIDPGGVMGCCPPAGDILWILSASLPGYDEFEVGVSEQADWSSTTNHNGPFVLRDICLMRRK